MKNLILMLFLALLLSCSTENGEGIVFETGIELSVINTEGQDLLNPGFSDSYKEGQIKLFYKIDGELQEVYDSSLDHPRNFFIYKRPTEYRIRIFPNTDKSKEISITLIQWSETDADTIRSKIERRGSITQVTKVWFNNELKWQISSEEESYFEVIK